MGAKGSTDKDKAKVKEPKVGLSIKVTKKK